MKKLRRFILYFSLIILIPYLYFVYRIVHLWCFENCNIDEVTGIGQVMEGTIGTIWTFFSTILIYLTLVLQGQELEAQQIEIKEQRKEFQSTSVINIVYQQLIRLEDAINKLVISYNKKEYHGISTFVMLRNHNIPFGFAKYSGTEKDATEFAKLSIEDRMDLKKSLNIYLNLFVENQVDFTSFTLSLYNSVIVVETFLLQEEHHTSETIQTVREIYFGNINQVVIPAIKDFHKAVQFSYLLSKSGDLPNLDLGLLLDADAYISRVLVFEKKISVLK
ncbi:MAG: hypothetical protein ACKVU0_00270 [Saprospiraceae bacterium]